MARKKPLPPGLGQGTGFYTQEIVKCLEQAHRASGQRPYTVFDDWTRIVEASLTALPDQLKSVASTGRFGPDTPETGEVFKQVRARYESAHYPAAHRNVWNSFARAFGLLLDSAEPGLWGQHGYGQFDSRVPKIVRQRRPKMAVLDKVTETEAANRTKIVRPAHFFARGNETGRSDHKRIGPEIVRLAPRVSGAKITRLASQPQKGDNQWQHDDNPNLTPVTSTAAASMSGRSSNAWKR